MNTTSNSNQYSSRKSEKSDSDCESQKTGLKEDSQDFLNKQQTKTENENSYINQSVKPKLQGN